VFVQGLSDLQPVDEPKREDFFTTFGYFGYLALEEFDVQLETVSLHHLDGEEMTISLGKRGTG